MDRVWVELHLQLCLLGNRTAFTFTFTFIYATNRDVEHVTPDKAITLLQRISNYPAPYGLEYGPKEPAFESQEGQHVFLFSKSPRRFWGPHSLLLCYVCQGFSLREIKRPRLKADHSPLFTPEIENKWSHTSTPHIPPWRVQGQLYFYLYFTCTYVRSHVHTIHYTSLTTDTECKKFTAFKSLFVRSFFRFINQQ